MNRREERQWKALRDWLSSPTPWGAVHKAPAPLIICSREQALELHRLAPDSYPHPDEPPPRHD